MCQKIVKALLIAYPLLVAVACEMYINYATNPASNMNVHTIIAVLIFGITIGGLDRDMESFYWVLPGLLYNGWVILAVGYCLNNIDRDDDYILAMIPFAVFNCVPAVFLSLWRLFNTIGCGDFETLPIN